MQQDSPPIQPPASSALRPLYDVWLRPRKVFRELLNQPIGPLDFILSAAQGVVGWLAFSRMQNLGETTSLMEIFGKALSIGAITGIAGVWIQAWIYAWLGRRVGGTATRAQVIHVLAYGSVPLVGSLLIWLIASLLLGAAAIVDTPSSDTDTFVALLMNVQIGAHVVLVFWSGLLQIMGLSEVHRVTIRGAIGTWLLGQLLAVLAMILVVIFIFGIGAPLPKS